MEEENLRIQVGYTLVRYPNFTNYCNLKILTSIQVILRKLNHLREIEQFT
jgi:hypothetical protein